MLGSQVSLNGYPLRIVGVVEPAFHGLEAGRESDVYIPIHMTGEVFPSFAKGWSTAGWHWLWTVGRLQPGVTVRQAEAALNVLAPQVAAAVTQPTQQRDLPPVEVAPGAQGTPYLRRTLERPVALLMGITGLVLLIACVNAANLWLAGAAARRREMAIREAVGASRWRLMRQLLTESALVAALGGAAGLLLASWVSDVLAARLPGANASGSFAHGRARAGVHRGRLAAHGAAVRFGARLARQPFECGLSHAAGGHLRHGRPHLRRAGVDRGAGGVIAHPARGGRAVRAHAGQLARYRCGHGPRSRPPGDIQPADLGYSGQRLRAFYDDFAERARSHPGVTSASLSLLTPLSGAFRTATLGAEGYRAPDPHREYYVNPVSAGYFATMGIPMLAGRDFLPGDEPAVAAAGGFANSGVSIRGERPRPELAPRRVAILSESLARRFFGSANAVGRRLSYGGQFWPDAAFEVVGMVKDVRYESLQKPVTEIMYTPNWVGGAEWRTLAVRTTGDPKRLVAALRADLRALDSAVPVQEAITLADQVDARLSTERLRAHLSTAFGLLAVLLAAMGLYGVLANGVVRRTREIGIRMAMGADRRRVLRMVLRESGAVALGGIAAGLAGAAALTRLIGRVLYGVKPLDLATFAGAAVLLLAVCLAAAWLPARRAASVDPIHALRYE